MLIKGWKANMKPLIRAFDKDCVNFRKDRSIVNKVMVKARNHVLAFIKSSCKRDDVYIIGNILFKSDFENITY